MDAVSLDIVTSFALATELTCLAVVAVILVSLAITRDYRSKLGQRFFGLLIMVVIILICDVVSWVFAGNTASFVRPLLMVSNFVTIAGGIWAGVLFINYLLTYLSLYISIDSRKIMAFAVGAAAVMTVVTATSPFTGIIYGLDENNLYTVGPLEGVSLLYVLAVCALGAALILRNRSVLDRKEAGVLIACPLLIFVGTILEILFPYVMTGLIYPITTIGLILLYAVVQSQEKIKALQRENSMRASLMLSQIQPHFLFNSLMSIRGLIQENPREADRALKDFSSYLRHNMNSLTNADTIPFAQELDHVNAYLALEKDRFGARLNVEYDIEDSDAMVPPLTLQPIVENAIRHGIMKREKGGTITLTTAKSTSDSNQPEWIIEACDDGVGFDLDEAGIEPFVSAEKARNSYTSGSDHIGINNVRSRLSALCCGTLSIESTPGEGTRATIRIPADPN